MKEIFRFCATKEIIKPNLTKSDKEKVYIHCKKKNLLILYWKGMNIRYLEPRLKSNKKLKSKETNMVEKNVQVSQWNEANIKFEYQADVKFKS